MREEQSWFPITLMACGAAVCGFTIFAIVKYREIFRDSENLWMPITAFVLVIVASIASLAYGAIAIARRREGRCARQPLRRRIAKIHA